MYLAFVIAFFAFLGAILFGAAGTPAIPMFWAYLAEQTSLSVLALILVYLRAPDLIRERMHPGEGEQDRFGIHTATLLFILHLGVAGYDVGRAHWTSAIPIAVQLSAMIFIAVGFGIIIWAMLVNRFFSSAVRLQADRGQQVITTGPYRYVRHPGYTGGIWFMACSGIALGSWFAMLVMLSSVPFIVYRTLIEERMLAQGLEGYVDYMRTVRYRLIPGVW